MSEPISRRAILTGMAVAATAPVMAAVGLRDCLVVAASEAEIARFGHAPTPVTVQERHALHKDEAGTPGELVFVERQGQYHAIGAIYRMDMHREVLDATSYLHHARVLRPSMTSIEYTVRSSGPVWVRGTRG